MMNHVIHELPNIDDPYILRCCLSVQNLRRTLSTFTQHVVSQLKRRSVATPTRVALMIVLRMTEGAVSIELLCLKNRVRDSAILLLSLYELQLDLQYISLDNARAETWIDHAKETTKPWGVMSQLREIYTNPTELAAERAIYRRYSMAKHSNPLGRNFSFPVAFTRQLIQLDTATKNSSALPFHIFGLGECLCRSGTAASRIWKSQGLNVGAFELELNAESTRLSKHNEEYVKSLLARLGNSTPNADHD
ncbi:MAG: hypothetical protein QOH70_1476 [Blastocatellia bacterium]|jgi:hypothetical protein|nr:hypothetical protein [Blastocatellia bacterium]